jgi:hypothetical protein
MTCCSYSYVMSSMYTLAQHNLLVLVLRVHICLLLPSPPHMCIYICTLHVAKRILFLVWPWNDPGVSRAVCTYYLHWEWWMDKSVPSRYRSYKASLSNNACMHQFLLIKINVHKQLIYPWCVELNAIHTIVLWTTMHLVNFLRDKTAKYMQISESSFDAEMNSLVETWAP